MTKIDSPVVYKIKMLVHVPVGVWLHAEVFFVFFCDLVAALYCITVVHCRSTLTNVMCTTATCKTVSLLARPCMPGYVDVLPEPL